MLFILVLTRTLPKLSLPYHIMLEKTLKEIHDQHFSPLDLIPHEDLREKLISLVLEGVPGNIGGEVANYLRHLDASISQEDIKDAKVVIFGGGTGLSNIVGGSSKSKEWLENPFYGIKSVFSYSTSVVCITDDGGSTGELQKDLPLIALGDIRHVLVSSLQEDHIQARYKLHRKDIVPFVANIAHLFNFRICVETDSIYNLRELESFKNLPYPLREYLYDLYILLQENESLRPSLKREHCLGNLFLAAAIYDVKTRLNIPFHEAIERGLLDVSKMIGVPQGAVYPVSSTPAQLRALYTNGVESLGEHKIGNSSRGFPVGRIEIDFSEDPCVYDSVLEKIAEADLLIFAPGSLYSSIIPILKIPQIVKAIRENNRAQKILVSNLWVQTGETDQSIPDPSRKFFVSDMLKAYEANISGGTEGIFDEIVCLSLDDIPASILQLYAVEDKFPIYLDRARVEQMGYAPVECGVYSKNMLLGSGVIQHDAKLLSEAIRTLFIIGKKFPHPHEKPMVIGSSLQQEARILPYFPCVRYSLFRETLESLEYISCEKTQVSEMLKGICWHHKDIQLSHLEYISGIELVKKDDWVREQRWDNILSFYDPSDQRIKIREDKLLNKREFEFCFLMALGESLLGRYAAQKEIIHLPNNLPGKGYVIVLREKDDRNCFFSKEELSEWLLLAKMNLADDKRYIRIINGGERFTPPALLLGLVYAWYLDNRLASHIEYKMSVLKVASEHLVPAEREMAEKRRSMIAFLRDKVFTVKFEKNDA